MADFIAGQKRVLSDSSDHILDLQDGLEFLRPSNDGIDLLKRIWGGGQSRTSVKFEWAETALASRSETVTFADAIGTSVTVAKARQYQVGEVLLVENEAVRVTAITNATTLAVQRGVAGSTAAAHAAKTMFSMGSADQEGSDAPAGIADTGDRMYNYIQTLTRAVNLSADEIAQASSGGNPLTGQLERRFIEINQQLGRLLFYGKRFEDTANDIRYTGGLKQFVTTNVLNAAGAVSVSNIDSQILKIVLAGGDPKVMVMHPSQKQKLDALDTNKQFLGKREHTGGNLDTQTWQSGVLNHTLDILTDPTVMTDELWILDTDNVAVDHLSGNGVNGNFHVEDSTTPGADRTSKVIRGKYGFRVQNEKAHAYLYGLS